MKESPIYSHIAAVAANNTIGLQGQLPWHIAADLQFFKQTTLRKIVIMGRKTFESLGRPLASRLNIIISKNNKYPINKPNVLCSSLEEAYTFCESADLSLWGKEIFIIGGGEIYRQSLSKVIFIYLTRIHREYPGDAFYPEISKNKFKEVKNKYCEGSPSYSFITYQRVSSSST